MRRFAANRLAVAGALITLVLVVAGTLAPWFAPHDPYAQNLSKRLQPASREHWLGTDEVGRDILSRIIY
ncbi:MAG: D,D-dipeptide ABC transporter permease, partial [Armatimonadota bacterium]|nr:D,D-dipeptide ABC transporter permease [Armatimonadota bacterium]